MIIFPKEIFSGAKIGLSLWFEKVIPSLLPFMVTTNCLISVNFPQIIGRVIQPFTKNVLNLTGTQAFPLIVGLTAGYPMGIKVTAQLYINKKIPKNVAHRLMLYSNNAGALFMLGTVGMGLFNSSRAGYFLMLCNYIAVLIIAIVSGIIAKPVQGENETVEIVPFSQATLAQAIENSISSILAVGCYIIIFSVISEIFARLHIFDGIALMLTPLELPKGINNGIAIGVLEITNACNIISKSIDSSALIMAAAIIGWGGLSVHAQSLEFLNGTDLDFRYYFLGKGLNCALSLVVAMLLWNYF